MYEQYSFSTPPLISMKINLCLVLLIFEHFMVIKYATLWISKFESILLYRWSCSSIASADFKKIASKDSKISKSGFYSTFYTKINNRHLCRPKTSKVLSWICCNHLYSLNCCAIKRQSVKHSFKRLLIQQNLKIMNISSINLKKDEYLVHFSCIKLKHILA